jgi:hypothetical protein
MHIQRLFDLFVTNDTTSGLMTMGVLEPFKTPG